MKASALLVLIVIVLGARAPLPIRQRFSALCVACPAYAMGDDPASGPKGKKVRAASSADRPGQDYAGLRKQLKRLKAENEELKSWPDYGVSVLSDDDT